MSEKTEIVSEHVSQALNQLRPLFVDEAELTFVMRVPGKPAQYMITSNDDLLGVSKVLAFAHEEDINNGSKK